MPERTNARESLRAPAVSAARGILMDGHLPGEIKVSSCYFSRFYTPEQCALMSYMDSGIIAGILGGGKIEFTERITEGCGGCKVFFVDNA